MSCISVFHFIIILSHSRRCAEWYFFPFKTIQQGGSNMTGSVTSLFTHKSVPVIFEPPRNYNFFLTLWLCKSHRSVLV